jgi:hypothetical protein
MNVHAKLYATRVEVVTKSSTSPGVVLICVLYPAL